MTFGKHKGKTFHYIFQNEPGFVWWVYNKASVKSPTMALFENYCRRMNSGDSVKLSERKRPGKHLHFSSQKKNKDSFLRIPDRGFGFMKECKLKDVYCRFCDSTVEVKETFSCDECYVCGFPIY